MDQWNWSKLGFTAGMLSSEVHLSQEDIDLIMSDSSWPYVFPDTAFSFKNLWKPDQTPQGMLYRKGEQVVCWIMPMSSMFAK